MMCLILGNIGDNVALKNICEVHGMELDELEGIWKEKGSMSWFCIVDNEKDEMVWWHEAEAYLESVPDDDYIAIIDCHI